MAVIKKATIMAVIKQTDGLISPETAANFIPLREGFSLESSFEELNSDELLNDLGASKSSLGQETVAGTHPIYLKNSQVEGVAPETAIFFESALGGLTTYDTEYDVVSAETSSITLDTGEGSLQAVGKALLIKDAVNGFSIRNIAAITGNKLDLNFDLSAVPAAGVNLGKPTLVYPTNTGHPEFSAWYFYGNGAAKQAAEFCRTNSISLEMPAGQFATASVGFEGTKSYWNPIEIKDTNKFVDFTDDAGTHVATLPTGFYSPLDLAIALVDAMNLVATDTISVSYNSQTGKYTFSGSGTVFNLLWSTGTNAANSVGSTIYFDVTSDQTVGTSHVAGEMNWASSITPEYDDSDNLVIKSAELMIGDKTDNFCRAAGNVTFNIEPTTVNVDSICSDSGIAEKLPANRTITMTASLVLNKHEAALYDKFIKNATSQVMMNLGQKVNNNWVAGKCVNVYMGNATITGHPIDAGSDYLIVNLAMKGFVTTTKKDVYINFL